MYIATEDCYTRWKINIPLLRTSHIIPKENLSMRFY